MEDVRMEWVKGKALKLMDETNGQLFDDMLAEDDGHLRGKMMLFLDEEILEPHDVTRRLFFLYKTHYERIMQEDMLVTEPGKISETSRTIIMFITLITIEILFALEYT
jgi:hypothetical protein